MVIVMRKPKVDVGDGDSCNIDMRNVIPHSSLYDFVCDLHTTELRGKPGSAFSSVNCTLSNHLVDLHGMQADVIVC